MPTHLQLEILSYTDKFTKHYKLDSSTDKFLMYKMLTRTTYSIVAIFRTSTKCYRVMFYQSYLSVRKKSLYTSFRSMAELCVWLDTLPVC